MNASPPVRHRFPLPADSGSSVGDDGDAEIDLAGGAILGSVEADQFAGCFVEAGLQTGDLAEPAVEFGLLDAGAQVGDDLEQSGSRGGVQAQARAADAGVFVFAGGAVGAATFADFELAGLEVLLEVAPFLVGGLAVFGLGSFGSPLVDEGAVGADEVRVEENGSVGYRNCPNASW